MRVLLTFMLLCVVSIVEASPTPDWVLGRGHIDYDSSRYLVGVGFSEKSTVSASESARAELIKSIRVRVNTVNKDYNSSDKSFSEASVSSETDFLLEGSQVKDGWYDEDKEIFYSLVVIERKYVLETLKKMIDFLVTKLELTLRQADTFSTNGDVLKALVYYYDGYVESSKLFPFIQTYKSVILESDKSTNTYNFNILFKEKIQKIVDNVQLVSVSRNVYDEDIQFSIKATLNGQGIDNFPIKFYSVYKHFTERTFCKKNGCETRVNISKVVNDGGNTYLKAVVDMKTFEKYFTYKLDEKLFSRLGLLNVTFKNKIDTSKKKKQEVKIKQQYQPRNQSYGSQVRKEADDMDAMMQRELRGIRGNRPSVRYCSADGRYNSCNRNNRSQRGSSSNGSIDFNIGIGW
jgi:hypothetical protein